ncbi:hypothetical protein DTG28_23430 [Salmonella enterica subsp. salamae]|nr:hypothetical protein [Salmonella enterica subsp. salamae]ECW0141275.1 hypothetical protein [Salmonella enterica subsp. salamae]
MATYGTGFTLTFMREGGREKSWQLSQLPGHYPHQGKMCRGRTPMATLLDGKRVWAEKNLNQI